MTNFLKLLTFDLNAYSLIFWMAFFGCFSMSPVQAKLVENGPQYEAAKAFHFTQSEGLAGAFRDQFLNGSLVADQNAGGSLKNFETTDQMKGLALEIYLDAYVGLYLAELAIHQRFNNESPSTYFPNSHMDWKTIDCNNDFNHLPYQLGGRLVTACSEFKRTLENGGLSLSQTSNELSRSIKVQINQMLPAAQILMARGKELQKINPVDLAYLTDSVYSKNLLKVKSCVATLFRNSGPLNVVLNQSNLGHLSRFKKIDQSQHPNPFVPTMEFNPINTASGLDPLAVQLTSAKEITIKESQRVRRVILDKIVGLQNLRSQNKQRQELVEAMSMFPYLAGLHWYPFNIPNFNNLLNESAEYLEKRNKDFTSFILQSSLVLLGSIFVPGPGWAVAPGITLRLSNVIYSATLAGQLVYTGNYLSHLHSQNNVGSADQYLDFNNPFASMRAEAIENGFLQGHLTLALGTAGEALAFYKVGNDLVGSNASKFLRWLRYSVAKKLAGRWIRPIAGFVGDFGSQLGGISQLTAKLKARTAVLKASGIKGQEYYDEVKKLTAEFTQEVEKLKKPSMATPRTRNHMSRAIDLIRHIEQSPEYQRRLIEIIRRLPNEQMRKSFLEELMFSIYTSTNATAQMSVSKGIYLQTMLKQLDELGEVAAKGKIPNSYKMVNPATAEKARKAAAIIDQEIAKLHQNGESVTSSASEKFKKRMKEKLKSSDPSSAKGRLKNALINGVMSGLDKNLKPLNKMLIDLAETKLKGKRETYLNLAKSIDDVQNQTPLMGDFLHETLEATLKQLDDLLQDPQISQLVFTPPRNVAVPNYGLGEGMYYINKILYVAEAIDDHMLRLASNGGRVYVNLKETMVRVLEDLNSAPLSKAVNIAELSSVISRLMIAAHERGQNASPELMNPHNLMDCSIQ